MHESPRCPKAYSLLAETLGSAVRDLIKVCEAMLAHGDVSHGCLGYDPLWTLGFKTDPAHVVAERAIGCEPYRTAVGLAATSAHDTLRLTAAYGPRLESALAAFLAFRDGLATLHPSLFASLLGHTDLFQIRLYGAGVTSGRVDWHVQWEGALRSDSPTYDTPYGLVHRWKCLFTQAAHAAAHGPLSAYNVQGQGTVHAPDAPSAAILASAITGKPISFDVFRKEDPTAIRHGVDLLLKRRTLTGPRSA